MIAFEVGKFYSVQVGCWSRMKIPAMCVRKTKFNIWFMYLCRDTDKSVSKQILRRKLERNWAFSRDRWSGIAGTNASELANKPAIWDTINDAEMTKNRRAK